MKCSSKWKSRSSRKSFASKVFVLRSFRNYRDWNGGVVQNVMADAAENTPPDNAEASGTHHYVVAVETIHAVDDHFSWRRGVLRMHTALNLKSNPGSVWSLTSNNHRWHDAFFFRENTNLTFRFFFTVHDLVWNSESKFNFIADERTKFNLWPAANNEPIPPLMFAHVPGVLCSAHKCFELRSLISEFSVQFFLFSCNLEGDLQTTSPKGKPFCVLWGFIYLMPLKFCFVLVNDAFASVLRSSEWVLYCAGWKRNCGSIFFTKENIERSKKVQTGIHAAAVWILCPCLPLIFNWSAKQADTAAIFFINYWTNIPNPATYF